MAKTTIRCIILLAAALLLTHAAAAEAQKIGELVNANKIEYTACKYKEAQMRDEARHYDRVKADLPGMEKRAADLQAKLDLVNPKYREASQKFTRARNGAEGPRKRASEGRNGVPGCLVPIVVGRMQPERPDRQKTLRGDPPRARAPEK